MTTPRRPAAPHPRAERAQRQVPAGVRAPARVPGPVAGRRGPGTEQAGRDGRVALRPTRRAGVLAAGLALLLGAGAGGAALLRGPSDEPGAAQVADADAAAVTDRPAPEADLRPVPVPVPVTPDAGGSDGLTADDRAAGLLSTEVPEAASGVLDVVPGTEPAPGAVGVRTVRVEMERGLPVDGGAFAATVMSALNDPRGWGARGDVTFARTDGPADLRVVLGSPAMIDALCAPLDTAGQVSCGRNGHAALNFRRWVLATEEFADRPRYREYLVNHEVGHLLGHPHEVCPGAGQLAPVMQQQTLAVAPCVANGWPYPHG